ncbi:MAG: hypothetical protein QW740_03745 [Sulfolobales archaeon]
MSKRELPVYVAAVLTLCLTTLPLAYAPLAKASSSEEVDCLFLLAILDRVLEYAASGNHDGMLLASYMLNASAPRDIRAIHEKVYRLVLDYFTAITLENNISIHKLRKLLNELSEAQAYIDKLSRCSHDPEGAKALRVRASSTLNALGSSINRLVEDFAHRACGEFSYELSPMVSTYSPGDKITVSVKSEVSEVRVELYTWPQLQPLAQSPPCVGRNCSLEVEIPGAKSLVERGIAVDLVSHFALVARVGGSTCFLGLLRVSYLMPSLVVDVPTVVRKGRNASIEIRAGETYEVTAYLNNAPVYSGIVDSSGVRLELSTLERPVRTGPNTLRVCVNATTRTLPHCFQSVFVVEPRYPEVSVYVPKVSVSWLGYITISLVNKESVVVDGAVSVNGLRVYRGLLESSTLTAIAVFTGYLPIQRVVVEARFRATAGDYDEAVVRYEVICVSILPLIALASAALAAPLLVSGAESSFIVAIRSRLREVRVTRRVYKSLAKVLEPYALGLGSSIASLYYSLLRKLEVRPPLYQETLREHFSSTIESSQLRVGVKKLLWVFLTLVERDLYSRRKPEYEEARKLYRGVLSEARE